MDVRSRDDGDAQRDGGRCGVRVERREASRRRKLRRDPRDEFSRTRAVRQTRRDANVDSTRARGGRRGGRVRAERALGRARKTNLVPGRRPSVGDDARRDDGVYAQERGEDGTRRRRGRRGPRRRGGRDRRARALRKDARRRGRRSDVHGKDGAGVVPRRGTRRRPTRASLSRARRSRRVGRPVASGRRASRGVDPLHRSERTARTPDGHDGSRRRARRGGVSHRELGGGGDGEFRRRNGRRDGRRDGRLQFRLRLGSRDASRVRIRQTHRSRLGDVRALASRRRRVRLRARTRFPRVARGSEARDATFPRRRRVGVLRPIVLRPIVLRPNVPRPHLVFRGRRSRMRHRPRRTRVGGGAAPTHADGQEKTRGAFARRVASHVFGRRRDAREGDVPGRAIVRGGRSPRLRHRHPRNNRASGGRRARVRIRVRVVEGGDDGVVPTRPRAHPRRAFDRGGR